MNYDRAAYTRPITRYLCSKFATPFCVSGGLAGFEAGVPEAELHSVPRVCYDSDNMLKTNHVALFSSMVSFDLSNLELA